MCENNSNASDCVHGTQRVHCISLHRFAPSVMHMSITMDSFNWISLRFRGELMSVFVLVAIFFNSIFASDAANSTLNVVVANDIVVITVVVVVHRRCCSNFPWASRWKRMNHYYTEYASTYHILSVARK